MLTQNITLNNSAGDNVRSLKFLLTGLWEKESEIEDFLKTHPVSFDFLHPSGPGRLLLNLHHYKHLQMRFFLKKLVSLRDEFCIWKNCREPEAGPSFLIRVDDFPHWDRSTVQFRRFHDVMEKFEVPYLLAVTANLSLNRHDTANVEFRKITKDDIKLVSHPLIETGVHGYSHQTVSGRLTAEFAMEKENAIEQKIAGALEIFGSFGIVPRVFVPPFDRIDVNAYRAVSKRFPVCTGGPASCRYMGYKLSPVVVSGTVYVPSYRPLCQGAAASLRFLSECRIKHGIILPVVLHWANEIRDGFCALEKFLGLVKTRTIRWKTLYEA